MTEHHTAPARKLSRQQIRAQAREKHDARGWIAALETRDPWMKQSIRTALGDRHATRAELETAMGISLADTAAPRPPAAPQPPPPPLPPDEPERIAIQHILISFAGAGTSATRTREAADKLAGETLERAQGGEAFDGLVTALTDDSAPGIYQLCNTSVAPRGGDEHPRGRMVPAFGDVGFALPVGGIGMASHDPTSSPYGWHIIKRLE